MKTATVRQLRNEFPRLLAALADGEIMLITKRNAVIAKLSLPTASELKPTEPKKKPDFKKRFSLKGWKPPKKTIDAVKELIESRGE